MAFYQTVTAGSNLGTYNPATTYTVNQMVSTSALDVVTGAGLRFKAKQSTTGNAPTLSVSDANWALVHPSNSLQVLNAIGALMESTLFMGSGNAWTRRYRLNSLNHPTAASRRFILSYEGLGLAGADKIGLVLAARESTAVAPTRLIQVSASQNFLANTGGVNDQRYRGDVNGGNWLTSTTYAIGDIVTQSSLWWLCVTAHTSATVPSVTNTQWQQLGSITDGDAYIQPGTRTGSFAKHWNGGTGDIPLCLWANTQRVMWVTLSDTRHHFAHAGMLLRFGSRSQLPYPVLITGNGNNLSLPYDSTTDANFPISPTTSALGFVNNSDNTWSDVSNCDTMPYEDNAIYGGRNAVGDYGLEDVVIHTNPGGLQGRIDGLFYICPENLVSGNTVSIGGVDYLVYENVYRGQSGGFMALKKE